MVVVSVCAGGRKVKTGACGPPRRQKGSGFECRACACLLGVRWGRSPRGGGGYDVFGLPSGHVCAVIGDVTRTGLNAAVIMGRMRSA